VPKGAAGLVVLALLREPSAVERPERRVGFVAKTRFAKHHERAPMLSATAVAPRAISEDLRLVAFDEDGRTGGHGCLLSERGSR
jgi:hypothetical protein